MAVSRSREKVLKSFVRFEFEHFLGAKSAEPHGALSGADDGHEHVADVFD